MGKAGRGPGRVTGDRPQLLSWWEGSDCEVFLHKELGLSPVTLRSLTSAIGMGTWHRAQLSPQPYGCPAGIGGPPFPVTSTALAATSSSGQVALQEAFWTSLTFWAE